MRHLFRSLIPCLTLLAAFSAAPATASAERSSMVTSVSTPHPRPADSVSARVITVDSIALQVIVLHQAVISERVAFEATARFVFRPNITVPTRRDALQVRTLRSGRLQLDAPVRRDRRNLLSS